MLAGPFGRVRWRQIVARLATWPNWARFRRGTLL
jgi:hypothetical protein